MIQRAENADLVLVYSDTRFPTGALLTQAAYTTFLNLITEEEKSKHTASLVSIQDTFSLKMEFYGTLDLH